MPASLKARGPATWNARELSKVCIWLTIGVSTLSPVYVLGTGESVETPMVSQMQTFDSSRAFQVAGPLAFKEAGITHGDVDHLMIYDAFAHLPLYGLGDLGFMPHEETGKFIADGNTRPGGKLPLNTNGGGLSYMHSGMYGMY